MSFMPLSEKLHTALEQELRDHIDASVLKRGWQYYVDGRVQNTRASEYDTLYGIVQGSDLYSVVMDASHFAYSSCTCPEDHYCKHMAAVLFQACSELPDGHKTAERTYFRMLGLTSASEVTIDSRDQAAVAAGSVTHPLERASGEEWLAWMEQSQGETWRKCRHSLHALQPVLQSLKGLSKDWEKPRQRLHWATAVIFVLEQAEMAITTVDSFSRYYHEMSFIRMAEPWVEHLYTLIGELVPADMDDAETRWADLLVAVIKARASNVERQLFEWEYIYLSLSEKLSSNREWFERELTSMLEAEKEEPSAFVQIAIAMMYFFDNQDDKSMEHFAKASFDKAQRVIYPCAAQRMEEEKWELVELWMSFLYERIYPNRNGRTVGVFVTLCRRADQDRPDLPQWSTYMTELLPFSYLELSEHWLGQQRYEEWADLQLLTGARLEDVGVQALREVAKSAPQVLLPLYHQSIDASIQSRNRQGYKMAVKQLKKLERLYKSEQEDARWDNYIKGLTSKYQRLRAFQEELWKGKIVT
ncbi:SWIM zinc finger family protein [Paenibacillus sp. 2TAB19]|uniref:SWIM zinc finger family protein n=1 Tax=Paenibacillus sp. 2TAB19 TaxID=3233003 RepID=UPI003F988943